jgi:hypothetical protein
MDPPELAEPCKLSLVFKYQSLIDRFLARNPEAGWYMFYRNPNPIVLSHLDPLLFTNEMWRFFSRQAYALPILLKHSDCIHWAEFSRNLSPVAVALWEQNLGKVNWKLLSSNPTATPLLKKYPQHIEWYFFSRNTHPEAVALMAENLDKVDWRTFSDNPAAVDILKQFPENIHWTLFSRNPAAVDYLADHVNLVDWSWLSENPNGHHLLAANISRVNWDILSCNAAAISILVAHPDNINWEWLSANTADGALALLASQSHKIDWYWLAENRNPLAPHLFCQYPDKLQKINMAMLINNPALFTLDEMATCKAQTRLYEEELFAKALHPDRVAMWLDAFLAEGRHICDFQY